MSAPVAFIAASVPGLPQAPIKVASTDTPTITIQWSEPQFNGGSPIIFYNVYVED